MRKATIVTLVVAGMTAAGIAWYHQVDRSLSEEDKYYADAYIVASAVKLDRKSLADEIAFLRSIQQLVLAITPDGVGIPNDQLREPRQVLQAATAMCFDRARLMEKIYMRAGFEVRHASLYLAKSDTTIPVLLTPGIASHAILEVRTKGGWVVLDSNTAWLAIDKQGTVYSMSAINSSVKSGQMINWQDPAPFPFFVQPTSVIYGLYSRHGRFYPPFNRIPDVNYLELLHNFW